MAQQRPQAASGDTNPHLNDMSVGEILRRTRLHYDQSIEDIERSLRIRAVQIEAMENGQFEKLPGPVYTVGFIRTYSEYLGLDSEKMISLYKSQSGTKVARPELSFPAPASESKVPQKWLVAASLVLAIAIMSLWWSMGTHDRSVVNNVPPVPASIKAENNAVADAGIRVTNTPAGPPKPQIPPPEVAAATAPAAGTAVSAATEAEAPQQPATVTQAQIESSKGIILKIIQNSWVEIKDQEGKEIVSRVLKAGDRYFVPARPDLFMSLGNSGGVKIEIDGKELPDIGGPGEVLRNIPLDIDFLKKKFR